ncbi:MAG: DEAD/DEAH box helicase [Candidatus Sericytochromatia bacterium]|nr:DEAD/DEAH box helicase [Candidatus Sericytochromatia bacterium]
MIVLHLSYFDKQFAFWADTPELAAPATPGQAWPGLLRREMLYQILRQLKLSERPEALHLLTPWLWAPDARGLQLQPWQSQALKLPPGKVLSWLRDWGHLAEPLTATRHGAEITVWYQLLRLAASLVWRQALLPDLQQLDADQWHSRWHALLSNHEHEQLQQLASYLPGVVQALTDSRETPPLDQPLEVLFGALQQLADALVRQDPPGVEAAFKRRRQLPAREAWLQALRRRNGQVQGKPEDLQPLQRQISRWQETVRLLADAPFQLVFQLEEPSEAQPHWFLRLLLQWRQEPGLYIPVDVLWLGLDQQPESLRSRLPAARSFVQAAIAQAGQLCPLLHGLHQHLGPDLHLELNLSQVEQFLACVQDLEQAGFGLRLPAWWLKGATRLRGSASFQGQGYSAGKLSLNAIVEANWQLMLGDEAISIEELRALAAQQAPLLQWRGRWLAVDPEQLAQALAFWQRQQNMQLKDLLALGAAGESAPFELERIQLHGELQEVLERLRGVREPDPIGLPKGFSGTLRPYQERGLNWLAFLSSHGLGACLADDMGLGKTIQTLALIQHFYEQGQTGPYLLVCPSSLLSNWAHEARRFAPQLQLGIHHGPERLRGEALREQIARQTLTITSYALAQRDQADFAQLAWQGVILDEAQNIKNPLTKQSKAVRSLNADWRLVLTGTPVENHVGDLWSLMDFLNPGLLGSQHYFKSHFLTPIQRLRDPQTTQRLHQLTAPFILRRLKSDPAIAPELPEKQEMKVYCPLSREQASLYAAVVQEIENALAGATPGLQRRGLILKALIQLKQICNHPLHFLKESGRFNGRSGKLDRLQEMLAEVLVSGEKALVFTQFAEMGTLLQQALHRATGQEILFLHGGTPVHQRGDLVARFQNEADCPIFVLSLKAGGTGLNLTAASHVFHFDRWWNPAVENQATDRAYRIGQTRRVQVHKLICSGTLEEKIDSLIDEKQALAGQIIGSGEQWLTELDDDQLRDLFQMNQAELAWV